MQDTATVRLPASSTAASCLLTIALLLGSHRFATAAPQTAASPAQATPSSDSAEQLRADLIAATQLPGVQHASWGIVVQSLDRSDRLFELNAHRLFVPASVAKLVSAASAIDAVGWDYRFETTLRTNGSIVDGVLTGDLVITGSGDPSIGGRGGDELTVWVDALRALGIRRVDGRVIGDDDALEEPRPALAWTWDDLGYPTGALFGALNFAENRTAVIVSPGAAAGAPTVLSAPGSAALRPLINRSVTGVAGSPPLLWPEQRPGESMLTIAGSLPVRSRPATVGISAGNPTLWLARNFRAALERAGIAVSGEALDIDDISPAIDSKSMRVLYAYRSHPLSELVRPLFKQSINLYGEAFMRLNAAPGTLPTNDAALDGLKPRLAAWGVAADEQQLVDGSGLSRRDAIAPEVLLTVLGRMYDATGASPWMTALPIAGVDGSLENRMKGTPASGNVRAKTGSMSNIRSLAGYVTTRSGEHLAFVVMVNNFEGTGAEALQAIDTIAVRLASFSR
jgi:D-alanyl-D-alanine carboxypeptidase/D-alanyl-D-alanine-endopeptidase (penicillin-binding protein 4)